MFTSIRIIAAVALLGLLFGASALSGSSLLWTSLSVTSLLFVSLGTVGVLLLVCDPCDWRAAAVVLPRSPEAADDVDRLAAAGWLRWGCRAAISSGVIGFLLHLIVVFQSPSSPQVVVIAAPGLLPLLYGLVISEFFLHPMAVALDCSAVARRGDRWAAVRVAVMAGIYLSFLAYSFVPWNIKM